MGQYKVKAKLPFMTLMTGKTALLEANKLC